MAVARWGAVGALLGWLAGTPALAAAEPTATETDATAPTDDVEPSTEADAPAEAPEAGQPAEDGDPEPETPPVQRPTEAEPVEPAPSTTSPAKTTDGSAAATPPAERKPAAMKSETSPSTPGTDASSEPHQQGAAAKKTPPPIDRPRFPALVIAGGPMIGPHAFGNEECRPEIGRCEKNGTFFGLGLQVELRARLYKPLFIHGRTLFVGNVSPNVPIYRGAYGFGAGLGAYGRYIFGRAEYLFFDAFGDNTFPPPFGEEDIGRDAWSRHAGLVTVGFRKTFMQRLAVELWAGPMFGPRSERTFPDVEPDVRTLITFMAGINVAYDILRDYKKR